MSPAELLALADEVSERDHYCKMTRTELIIQLLKMVIGLAFGAYFVWWSLERARRISEAEREPRPRALGRGLGNPHVEHSPEALKSPSDFGALTEGSTSATH
jgi:hypothetical protein